MESMDFSYYTDIILNKVNDHIVILMFILYNDLVISMY
jgi:hypothetical protein